MAENDPELRERIKRRTPKCYLAPEHLAGARLLPTREHLLDRMKPEGVVAEVGVGFGEFTAQILERCRPRRLHLIDAWADARYAAGRATVERRFAEAIASGRVVLHAGRSIRCLAAIPDATFDWVYIDSDHTYETTAQELDLAARKLKRGGRIAGHDWTTGNCIKPWPYGVIEAANQFCVEQRWRYQYLTMEPHGHLSFCLRPQPRPRPS